MILTHERKLAAALVCGGECVCGVVTYLNRARERVDLGHAAIGKLDVKVLGRVLDDLVARNELGIKRLDDDLEKLFDVLEQVARLSLTSRKDSNSAALDSQSVRCSKHRR